jgi:outer membrane protein OmpA-like peptidoglycan-associated protein
MRKLLTCSTALTLALSSFHTLPARAQTLAEDGSVIGPDGAVLCTPTAEAPCDLEAITKALAEETARVQAEAAAQAEAEAAAKAEAEAAAQAAAEEAARAEAEAKATAEAAAQAAAEAAAQAEAQAAADAAAQAEADAAAQAEAEAAAQAAADEAARVEAEAQAAAAAAAEAEAAAQAEAQAAAEAAAQAEAEAAAAAATEEPAAPEAAPEPTPEPVPEVAVDPAPEVAPEPVPEPAPEVATDPAPETAPDVAADPAPEPAPEVTAEPAPETAPEATPEALPEVVEAAPGPAAEPVDIPVVNDEAAASLESILGLPAMDEEGTDSPEETAAAAVAAAAAAAGLVIDPELPVTPAPEGEAAASDALAEGAAPVSVATEIVSEDSTRSSDEEFAAAPTAVEGGKKKSGLSDLEKAGLLALGAVVVGAIINEGKKDQKTVVENSGDRVIVENPDGSYTIYKDDDAILRRPGVRTVTETYSDGSTRTVVQRADGTQVVTVRDASGRVLRRSVYDVSGVETVLIDDLAPEEPIIISDLPRPREDSVTISTADGDAALKAELAALEAESLGRKFSLRQIRDIPEVRALAATVEVESITFDTGSSVIRATEARKLADLGQLLQQLLTTNPGHVFLIEGHTDAVGSATSNLLLSDRRAESLALALTEYFEIPPENVVVQGYGESELKVDTLADERANRRVVVRLITPLMRTADLR